MSEPIWPKFKISLTKEQTLELGRLTVTWGQIDHFVFCSVSELLATDMAAGNAMFGDLTTGPLVNHLCKSRHRIADKEMQKTIKQFCDDMGPLIRKRNQIMHGMWGFFLPGKNPNKAKPACHFAKEKSPIFPEEITSLANKAAEQTYVASHIWHHIIGQPVPDGTPKFFFGQHTPRLPKGTQLVEIARAPKGHPR